MTTGKTDTTNCTPRSYSSETTNRGIFFQADETAKMAAAIHYPEHWDTAAYPNLAAAVYEIVTNEGCSECPTKP